LFYLLYIETTYRILDSEVGSVRDEIKFRVSVDGQGVVVVVAHPERGVDLPQAVGNLKKKVLELFFRKVAFKFRKSPTKKTILPKATFYLRIILNQNVVVDSFTLNCLFGWLR